MSIASAGSGNTNSVVGGLGGKRGSLSLIGERLGLGELGQLNTDHGSTGEVGLGIQSDTPEQRTEAEANRQEVKDREWRETVRNLLLVVDGMVSCSLSPFSTTCPV